MQQRLVVVDLSAPSHVAHLRRASLRRVADTLRGAGRTLSVRGGSDEMHAALTAAGVLLAGRA